MDRSQSTKQICDLFLEDKEGGLVFCSPLRQTVGSFQRFETMNIRTGAKYQVTFKIEEIK